jgi:transposase
MTRHYVGLDVALKETQICVIDEEMKIVAESKTDTSPEAISIYLRDLGLAYHRIGLETGSLAHWIYIGLARSGLPAFVLDARKVKSFLRLETTNKNDRNDARGLARMMCFGTPHVVHVKSEHSQRMRALLAARKTVQIKMIDLEMFVRGIIRQFGLKIGSVSRPKWEARVRELVAGDSFLRDVTEPVLTCWRALRAQLAELTKQVSRITRQDPVCRLLMTCPGVGPVISLSFKSAVDIPERFQKSRSIGAALGLTPRQTQSGEVDHRGKISKAGDQVLRTLLVEAAFILLRMPRSSALKAWGVQVAKRRGIQRAVIAVARKLAVIMHRMWMDNTEFRWEDSEPMRVT